MASDNLTTTGESDWPVTNPWPLLGYGLAATLLAVLVAAGMRDDAWPLLRFLLIFTGLVAAGGAVSIRPRSALVTLLATVTGLLAHLGLCFPDEYWLLDSTRNWDSARLVVDIMTAVAFFATLVNGIGYCVALVWPGKVNRILFSLLFSLLILVHFGGILSAVTSIPPPSGQAPWIPNQLWTRFYRPYLQFGHLNNAYHFYSPEPGPPTLFWILIQYEDGSKRWVTIPNREENNEGFLEYPDGSKQAISVPNYDEHNKDPLKQEWYRRLSLTESTNQLQALPMIPDEIRHNRHLAGQTFARGEIPLHPYLPEAQQFRLPQYISLWMVPSYARHIALSYPHPIDPSVAFKSVKIYRVVHSMLEAKQFNREDLDPTSPVLYFPYYHGEFDKEGKLLRSDDPFLYWLIPIIPVYANPRPADNPLVIPVMQDPTKLPMRGYFNYLNRHAGVRISPWGEEEQP